MEPLQQLIPVGGLGFEQAKQDFIRCEAFHLPILSWNRLDRGREGWIVNGRSEEGTGEGGLGREIIL
jgi:hypothetical protein